MLITIIHIKEKKLFALLGVCYILFPNSLSHIVTMEVKDNIFDKKRFINFLIISDLDT